jgi:hypothetical protein
MLLQQSNAPSQTHVKPAKALKTPAFEANFEEPKPEVPNTNSINTIIKKIVCL